MNFAPSPKSASVIAREARQSKGRNRHLPHQTEALNEVFERSEHPSLEERTELAKRLDMETKVVNSWFQNKRASIKKKAQRSETSPPPPVMSASPVDPTPVDMTAVPPRSQHPSLPPRSQHPSLPPIANLLQGSPPPAASSISTDPEDDNMTVQLPPIRENAITRPAFLSPKLAAVCLPKPLPDSSSGYAAPSQPHHGPLHRDSRSLPPLSMSRGGSPRSVSDSFPERRARQSRGFDPIGLSGRHPTASPSSRAGGALRNGSPLVPSTMSSTFADYSVRSGSRPYSREQSLEVDELMDDSPAASVASHTISHKARRRPSPEQLEQLRNTFDQCTHPSREERERLAHVTGMRMQSIANWFQHQRSMAKRREGTGASQITKLSAKPNVASYSRGASPSASASMRPKRSRPEPFQLEALKELYEETATPTMEQRSALAVHLGMTESKITNWFRNARQTAKKKGSSSQLAATATAADSDSDAEMDDEPEGAGANVRVHGTPTSAIAPSSTNYYGASPRARESNGYASVHGKYAASFDGMDVDDRDSASHTGSDEDEVVTPSPLSSTQPLYNSVPKTVSTVDDAALLLNLRAAA